MNCDKSVFAFVKICRLNIKLNIINSKPFLLFIINSAVVFADLSGSNSVTIHN